ncbi:MAG: hypothetical protein K2Q09_01295 [Phycisphaerales bacterium]|nr:hypothetical protein [Phycisphaerales bacterium]
MVNRCVCADLPFGAVAALARRGKTFAEIREATDCCRGCGMCEPYVRLVIRTLVTDLPVLPPQRQTEVMRGARDDERHTPGSPGAVIPQ